MKTLTALRKAKGYTQRELAEKLSLATSTIAMYETGERNPSIKTAKNIADFFGVSIEHLFFGHYNHETRSKLVCPTGTDGE